jgi:hypothetical protein
MRTSFKRAVLLSAVPALATITALIVPFGAAQAGASTSGVGVAIAQVTSAAVGTLQHESIQGTIQIQLVGAVVAGNNTFVGNASIGSISYSQDLEGSGVMSVFGPESISGSGLLGSIHGTCGLPGTSGSDQFVSTQSLVITLNLACSVSINGGAAQPITIAVDLAGISLDVGTGSFSG